MKSGLILTLVYRENNYLFYMFYDMNGEIENIITTDYNLNVIYNRNEDLKEKLNIE